MSRRPKARGLLTLLVDGQQARRAVEAAFHGRAHKSGDSIYLDDPDEWFRPIGHVQFHTEPPTTKQKEDNMPKKLGPATMAIADAVTVAAHAVGRAVGLLDDTTVEYRQALALIAGKDAATTKVREIGERLRNALAAVKAGAIEFEGAQPQAAVRHLEWEYQVAADQVAKINRAELQAIGLCPDPQLQRERRRITADRKALASLKATNARAIEQAEREVRRINANLAGLTDYPQGREAIRARRELELAERDLSELREDRERLESEQVALDAERETLYAQMRGSDE